MDVAGGADVTKDDLGPRSGWYVDPLGPLGRRRWWSEEGWTARVAGPEEQEDGVAWRPDLADAPPPPVAPPMPSAPDAPRSPVDSLTPIRWYAPGYAPPLAVAPPEPEPEPATESVDDEPEPVAPVAPAAAALPTAAGGAEAERRQPMEPVLELPAAVDARRDSTPRRRRLGAALVAAALVTIAASAGAAIFGNAGRPEIAPVTVYRDTAAGFTLRYSDEWRLDSDTPGRSIRFSIGDAKASSFDTNYVSVVIGAADELPTLDRAVSDVTPLLQEDFPFMRLAAAENTELAGGPALRLQFQDVTERPPIRLEQFLGRTTAGKLLTVTITTREPRTAPTARELREFLDSITSL